MSVCAKRAGEKLTPGVVQLPSPSEALQLLEHLLSSFTHGDSLFITARTHDSSMSMWNTCSKAAGLYWCAAALGQLWQVHKTLPPLRSARTRTVA